jgi:transposase
MLMVGIDWAEAEHAVCLLTASGAVLRRLRVPHSAAGLRRLCAAIAAEAPEPAAVHVALERAHGLLVDALLEAGYAVYALNPKAVERYRDRTRSAGAKTDPADAELLARILVTDRERHRALGPRSPQVEAIRVLARDDERASRDQRRLLNRLRQDLIEVFPQALSAFPRLTDVSALVFLARWPAAGAARELSHEEIAQLLRAHQHGWPERTAARIHAALTAEALAAAPLVAAAKAGTIRLAAEQLLLLRRQRAAWCRQLDDLLRSAEVQSDGAVLLSLPGADARLAGRILGEIGADHERFANAGALQCYAGTAPVTKASGRSRAVSARFACNRLLRQALLRWAMCSLRVSEWARTFYDAKRAARQTHYRALRCLANRWLEILHHLLRTGQSYDEATHQRNRARAMGVAA